MDNNIVVIVNGKPRSGKDTFSKFIVKYCEEKDLSVDVWSTIDFEKDLLYEITRRDYDPNSELDRNFLSELKQLVNHYYNTTFRDFTNILEFFDGIHIVHSREWEEIKDFKSYCKENNIKCITVFIESNRQKEFYNYSDMFCDNEKKLYDIIIQNNGTLEELEENAKQFCDERLF